MGARETERGAIAREEITEGGGEEFTPVVALHAIDGYMKLGTNIRMKTMYSVRGVGFVAQGERPRKVREVIKNH